MEGDDPPPPPPVGETPLERQLRTMAEAVELLARVAAAQGAAHLALRTPFYLQNVCECTNTLAHNSVTTVDTRHTSEQAQEMLLM